MKMKMRLRKPVLAFLFLTVLAPIVLYTDKLSTFSADEFFQETSSVIPLNPDVRAVHFLLPQVGGIECFRNCHFFDPQESSTSVKEPLGVVYSENSTQSDSEKSRRARQLNEESNTNTNATDMNPMIRQVASNGAVHTKSEKLKVPELEQSEKVSERKGAKLKLSEKRNQGVGQLKDQLIRAGVYLSLSATRSNTQFLRELRIRMKEVQKALGDATNDSHLPNNANEKLKAMEQTLSKGKRIADDCSGVVKKLRAIISSTEQQLRVQEKQNSFLTQLTAKTVPKGLHCLPLRLAADYHSLNASAHQFPNQQNLQRPNLFHYALFSDNVLATAVVVNSTISTAKDSSKHVFHIVTDKLNYAAMRMWFLANPPASATIEVQNVDDFTWLNSSYSPVLRQLASQKTIDYYYKAARETDSNLKFRNPKYLSIMNHLRFYLAEMFPKLDKVVFLDDDIVVQKDLTGLWSLDMKGKVNAAVETCRESFHRFDRYLNFSNQLIAKNFDPRACGWAYGMNVFDLVEWRKQNMTEVYHRWQNLNSERDLWKLGTLPPGLITFYRRVFALDKSWHVLGLGYNPNVRREEIERAAVIHYNGNLKPWLEIGMPRFRGYWSRFIDYDNLYIRQCNISP